MSSAAHDAEFRARIRRQLTRVARRARCGGGPVTRERPVRSRASDQEHAGDNDSTAAIAELDLDRASDSTALSSRSSLNQIDASKSGGGRVLVEETNQIATFYEFRDSPDKVEQIHRKTLL